MPSPKFTRPICRGSAWDSAPASRVLLSAPVEGTVERVSREIGKQDVLATDPAARTDARVAEVEIRLDDSRAVAALTHLQVEIVFEPSP